MVRLFDASIEVNTWAGALNMFTLWMITASVAGLIFALSTRQPRQRMIAGTRLAPVLLTSSKAGGRLATTPALANWASCQNQTGVSRTD